MSCDGVSVVKVADVIPFELSITSDVIKFAAYDALLGLFWVLGPFESLTFFKMGSFV